MSRCDSDPCVHGYCIDYHGNMTCICDDGFTGDRCDVMVTNCSTEYCLHGYCNFDDGYLSCRCDEGYTGGWKVLHTIYTRTVKVTG